MDIENFFGDFDTTMGFERGRSSESTNFLDLLEWDSMTTLAVIAMIDEKYGVTLEGTEIAGCQTLGELGRLVQSRLQ
ncbi:MAG: acyl carrier protein [Planctomycetota bacterium]